MIKSFVRPAIAGAALIIAAACASTPAPPPAATLTFASTDGCSETLDAKSAQLVGVRKNQDSGNLTTEIDPASACQIVDGAEVPYALYRLPGSVDLSTVQAGGVMQMNRVFAAEVTTLDESLVPVRTFGPEAFMHRGGSWSVLFQPRSTERYVLVRADDDLIGDAYRFTSSSDAGSERSGAALPAGKLSVPYSYEGLAFARVYLKQRAPVGPNAQ